MQANYVQRLRLTFAKQGPTRYISHLNLAQALERTFNRARIPVSYSQGFNRRPRMQLAAALPLGYTSDGELADIWLEVASKPEVVLQKVRSMAPNGIEFIAAETVPLDEPALQTQTTSASYVVTLIDPVDEASLRTQIESLMRAKAFPFLRTRGKKRKYYDLRPHVLGLTILLDDTGQLQLHMNLTLQPSLSGRPDDILEALQIDPYSARVNRTAIRLAPTETATA